MTPPEFTDFVRLEREEWGPVVKIERRQDGVTRPFSDGCPRVPFSPNRSPARRLTGHDARRHPRDHVLAPDLHPE